MASTSELILMKSSALEKVVLDTDKFIALIRKWLCIIHHPWLCAQHSTKCDSKWQDGTRFKTSSSALWLSWKLDRHSSFWGTGILLAEETNNNMYLCGKYILRLQLFYCCVRWYKKLTTIQMTLDTCTAHALTYWMALCNISETNTSPMTHRELNMLRSGCSVKVPGHGRVPATGLVASSSTMLHATTFSHTHQKLSNGKGPVVKFRLRLQKIALLCLLHGEAGAFCEAKKTNLQSAMHPTLKFHPCYIGARDGAKFVCQHLCTYWVVVY